MKGIYSGFFTFLFLVVIAAQPVAGSGFRCGTKLVHIDDTKNTVVEKCGAPDSVEVWTEEHAVRHPYGKSRDGKKYGPSKGRYVIKKTVTIEEWTYNLGSNQFMRFLTFKNGKLTEIDTGSRGY